MSFTLRFTVVFFAGLLVAALIAPVAAVIVSHAGFHYPFQRIFDRVVIVSIFALIFASASKLRLMQLLRDAFAKPSRNAYNGLIGLAIALTAIAILFVAASLFASFGRSLADVAIHRFPKYLVASLAIAFMEEFFFRAILLGGIKRDFGATKALLASALIFAVVHMIKSAPHSYLTGFEPMAGIENLIENFALIGHKNFRLATLIGLFLLGILLGAAFIETGTVYFSIGLHTGFILGAKLWPKIIGVGAKVPRWLGGYTHLPLISGPAAWTIAIAILLLLRPLSKRLRRA